MTSVKMAELRKMNADHPGIFDAFLQRGEIRGDSIAVEREVFEQINGAFFGTGPQLGTLIHVALSPAVKIIDRVLGTDLANCGGCAERELKLNAATAKPSNP